MTTKNLLVELFVEELPPKALRKLGQSFGGDLHWALNRVGLVGDDLELDRNIKFFASPRRLAVWIKDVASSAPDRSVSIKLMPVAVGLSASGDPTPALLKKLAAIGAGASAVPTLKRQMDGKAEALFFDTVVTGATLAEGLQMALEEALSKLPIPKVMQYQLADGWTSVNFVRPAHGLVALHGDAVVPVSTLGLTAGRATHGHRFEAAVDPIELKDADNYAKTLAKEGAVIASFDRRRDEIKGQLTDRAPDGRFPLTDPNGDIDAALLDEVTALVERPNVLVCQFEPEFLAVPQECLILTMKANQKYFPLLDTSGKLTNQFLIVSNITPADPSRVIEGNERVVRPRLADAKFFFDQDQKRKLESRVAGLDKVVYHGKLGSQGERTMRVRAIAKGISDAAFFYETIGADIERAATLAKADLLTQMVGEFPELQGIMGRYYALHDQESVAVAEAIEDHYRPRFAGDVLPRSDVGIAVALADKLETLVGLFGIGQLPTGDKDPFALRRHALGVIRMLMERNVPIDVAALVDLALRVHNDREIQQEVSRRDHEVELERRAETNTFASIATLFVPRELPVGTAALVLEFMYDRLASSLREQGYIPQEVDAVLTLRPARLGDVFPLLEAVRAFAALPEAASLAAANKRVGNILKKSEGVRYATVASHLLTEPAEIELEKAVSEVGQRANEAFERRDYATSLKLLAALKTPIDDFFASVMVNVEDHGLRANRLGLLNALHLLMNRVADLSKLAS